MRRMLLAVMLTLAVTAGAAARAADMTEQDLLQAAIELGRQYDINYNAKNAAGMAGLYAPDGTFVSPGPVVRGTAALQAYYQSRFDAGAAGHLTKIVEVHLQGEGGYGIGQFTVSVPGSSNGRREIRGNLAIV